MCNHIVTKCNLVDTKYLSFVCQQATTLAPLTKIFRFSISDIHVPLPENATEFASVASDHGSRYMHQIFALNL